MTALMRALRRYRHGKSYAAFTKRGKPKLNLRLLAVGLAGVNRISMDGLERLVKREMG